MSKPKQGLVGKPSKASLKSRGLSTSNNTLRPGSSDACYSLYSTDSEDNVSGVSRGLDKCAELLTNILEIKYEGKGMKKSAYSASKQHIQPAIPKNKKAKSAPHSKSALTKIKPKATINIPTGEIRSNVQKSKIAYNERVVASTPVLTAEQRRHMQELHKREHALTEQIQLLQEEYNKLEKHSDTETSPQTGHTQPALMTDDNHRELQETKSSRRSLDFSTSAEKPFVDNPQTQRNSSTNDNVKASLSEGTRSEVEKTRKVQFVTRIPELQKAETNIAENTCENTSLTHEDRHIKSAGQSPKIVGETEELRKGHSKPESPQRYTDHLRILAYLVGELRAILASSGDNEVDRLLTEIESEIRLLTSYSVHSPRLSPGLKGPRPSPRGKAVKKQHDIDTEIALQPFRSENSDLRRKLRIANQKTRDLEGQLQKAEENRKEYPSDEGVVEQLHKQLFVERENVRQLRQQNEQAEKVIVQRNKEYSNFQDLVAEKDEELENLQDELRRHRSKTMTEADYHSKHEFESMEMTVRAKHKEVELLKLAVEQRDAEIERLTELTRGLQQSLTRVLTNVQDLHPEDVLSDVSVLSGIDSWKPMKMKPPNVLPSMVSTAARVYTHQPQTMVHSDEELDVRSLETGNREYDNVRSSVQGMEYRRTSIDSVNDDDTTISVSSADEFVFKQELANLDTMIARLQDSLRSK